MKKIFDLLSSFELLFILLALIIIAMALGTVLPQQSDPENYIKFWGSPKPAPEAQSQMTGMQSPSPVAVDREKGERKFNMFKSLGFLNLYHSTWFLVLCYILLLNISLCFLKRLMKANLFQAKVRVLPIREWERKTFPIPIGWSEERPIKLVEAYLLLSSKLRKSGFAIKGGGTAMDVVNPVTNGKHGSQLESLTMFATKGITAKPMSMLFHISMVLALLACGLGSLYAFESTILLEKGVKTDDWLNRREIASKTLSGELVGMAPSISGEEPRAIALDESKKESVSPVDSLSKIISADKTFMDKVVSAHKSMIANPLTIDHFDRLISYPKFYGAELQDFTIEYVSYKQKPSYKRWLPTVKFLGPSGKVVYKKVARSNYPAKWSGIEYYISDYLYKFQLIVESPDGTSTTFPSVPPDGKGFAGFKARKDFSMEPSTVKIDPLPGELKVKNVYAGRLYKTVSSKDFEMLDPYVDIRYIAPGAEGKTPSMPGMNDGGMPEKMPEYVKLRTKTGYEKANEQPVTIDGYKLYLGELNPIVEFGVRHDPGIIWFYFFGYLACFAMALRIYYPTYRLKITIETRGEDLVNISYHLLGSGLFSNAPEIRKIIILPKDIN